MNVKSIIVLALTLTTFSDAGDAQTAARPRIKEQSLFGAEEEAVDRPVKVPDGALDILRKDEQVVRYLESEQKSPDELTTEEFLASEIHLNGRDEVDLVVMGGGHLRGANVITFWVFRRLREDYKLVLKVAANGLKVQTALWKGFRNISTATPIAGSAVEMLYRFDGERYVRYREKSEPIQ